MELFQAQQLFKDTYGDGGEIKSFHSPGRVNLIGEHTDYNGGAVFPCALSFGTFGIARKRNDQCIKLASHNFSHTIEISLGSDAISYDKKHDWGNYPLGVVSLLQKEGYTLGGFELLVDGNIPPASGLSSSASLELLTCVVLKDLFDIPLEMVEFVKLSQRVENEFIGVNSGIMDQYAIGMGKKNHAMLLDCAKIESQYIPLVLEGYKLIIGNTNKPRELAESKYNERRSECEEAVADLNKELTIQLLADIDIDTFEKNKHLITNPIVAKRAEHVVYEIDRTLRATEKLVAGDLVTFGKLMNDSHISLRDLYEVTGVELDTMVEEAWKIDGVIGSRMTGAGFGGCTISLVRENAVDTFIQEVGTKYEQRTGLKPAFYVADTGDGAKRI